MSAEKPTKAAIRSAVNMLIGDAQHLRKLNLINPNRPYRYIGRILNHEKTAAWLKEEFGL